MRNRIDSCVRRWWVRYSYTLLGVLYFSFPANAIEKQTISNIADQTLNYNIPFELHITNTENAISNSSISLNHTDAWVFFDNIAPEVVISDYLQYIKVNGAAFIQGSNGRVAIYGHGTVLMPHSPGFTPLTLYSEESFEGDSVKFGAYDIHTDLAAFDSKAKSMWLKRGYMATVATKNDGTGYSRVFIADEEDIKIEALQLELYGTISFVRVVKHQWVTKKGKAGWDPHVLNGTTYYDWNIGGSSSNEVEYVAIKQNGGWPSWSSIKSKENISHVLGFNEPDRPDQANMTFQSMIDLWPGMLQTGLRIGSPAWSDAYNSTPGGNLFDFIDKCDELNYRVDFVALHCYWGGKPASNWYNDLKYIHERTGRPLWITEWNNGANWTTEWWPNSDRTLTDLNAGEQLKDMKEILQVLDTASFIERYFIYEWVQDCRHMIQTIDSFYLAVADDGSHNWIAEAPVIYTTNGKKLDGTTGTVDVVLTPTGEYYTANHSQIAYNSKKEVIPGPWTYEDPSLSYQYLSLAKKINLSFTDPNGSLTKGYILEKKVGDNEYHTILDTSDVYLTYYTDDLDNTISGKISYRLKIKTVYGDFKTSNEVSYYQSGGSDSLQFGVYPFGNKDWNTTLFSKEFQEAPRIISGIPTFNNVLPLTHRVSAVNSKSYKFQLDTWEYQNNPALSKEDNIAILAIPAGLYNFNGLKAEVSEATGVNGNWVSIPFEQEFDSVPVVFCTQTSKNTFFATMPAIRNVSKEGFELSIRCEEVISSSAIIGETVHFLAIEPGNGAIHDTYRISAGTTGDGEGLATNQLVVPYDSSYSQPALFASMQSTNDNFGSSLRHYTVNDFEYTIFKVREVSSSELVMTKEDILAWMVMDLASGQIIQNAGNIHYENLSFYPNPANDFLRFNFTSPVNVRVFDLYGKEYIHREIQHSLSLEGLQPGVYLLKADGYRASKFIKQ